MPNMMCLSLTVHKLIAMVRADNRQKNRQDKANFPDQSIRGVPSYLKHYEQNLLYLYILDRHFR